MMTNPAFSHSSHAIIILTLSVVFASIVACRRSVPAETAAEHQPSQTVITAQEEMEPSLAVSLTMLQAQARQHGMRLSDDLRRIGGINHIQGFFRESDGEIILFGTYNPEMPTYELDDLVVTLRNAYQTRGYEGVLGCTIDPQPQSQGDGWRIQVAKIFGMPPFPGGTAPRLGARFLLLDAELKKVSAGIISISNHLPSLYELTRTSTPLCPGAGHAEKHQESMHRFWFTARYPAAPRFRREPGIVAIRKPVEVQLLTERAFLDQTGKQTSSTAAAPLAEQFARNVTDILATVDQYKVLLGDYRLIELSQLLRFEHVEPQALRYFLEDHPVIGVPVPSFIGGIRREEQGEVVCDNLIQEQRSTQGVTVGSTERVYRYHFTSRGGVEAKVDVSPAQFTEEQDGPLSALRRRIRAARPAPGTLVWEVGDVHR